MSTSKIYPNFPKKLLCFLLYSHIPTTILHHGAALALEYCLALLLKCCMSWLSFGSFSTALLP
ncbi:hypothetical protein SLEP1_g18699 [Rubroshorea leprosula]|uniref:Uncharacterized protein n=1 Tax=Rubroshorea leprosula TaxID=152421 RepID=A0AAV5J903_9ROSI|nr:hypothetical protein SLEP1_g18699 [Rubroshorea leprosula]